MLMGIYQVNKSLYTSFNFTIKGQAEGVALTVEQPKKAPGEKSRQLGL